MNECVEKGLGLNASLDCSFEDAIERVREAFKGEGFGILTEIDVQSTLKQKIGVDIPRYPFLGRAIPDRSQGHLTTPEVGLLLPCNVLVYEEGGRMIVSALNPRMALGAVGDESLRPFAEEAYSRIKRAMDVVAAG